MFGFCKLTTLLRKIFTTIGFLYIYTSTDSIATDIVGYMWSFRNIVWPPVSYYPMKYKNDMFTEGNPPQWYIFSWFHLISFLRKVVTAFVLNNRIVYVKDGNEIWFYFRLSVWPSSQCSSSFCLSITLTMNIDGMPTCQIFGLWVSQWLVSVSIEHYLSVYNHQRNILSSVSYDLCHCLWWQKASTWRHSLKEVKILWLTFTLKFRFL